MPVIDPNIVYLVLVFGIWLGITAGYVPGTMVIEIGAVLGIGVALLTILSMPTNLLALIALVTGAVLFFVIPFIKQGRGPLAIAGFALQIVGSLFLFQPPVQVSLPLIAVVMIASIAFHRLALIPALAHHDRTPVMGSDELLIGSKGRVVQASPLTVLVQGETWSASSDLPLNVGDGIIVVEREGLHLLVEGVKHKRTPQPGVDDEALAQKSIL